MYKGILTSYFLFLSLGIVSITFILTWTYRSIPNKTSFIFHGRSYSCNASKLVSDLYVPGFEFANSKLCSDYGHNVTVINVIFSAPGNKGRRTIIRHNYEKFGRHKNIVFVFLVGTTHSSVLEDEFHGDIIRTRSVDSYWNLTLKSIAMLEWVHTYCNQTKFILKSDDDVFINIRVLAMLVEKYREATATIFGYCYHLMLPYRDDYSNFCVLRDQFVNRTAISYPIGGAYLLTVDVIDRLYRAALNQTFFHLEDVFLTGLVSERTQVSRVHVDNFLSFMPSKFNSCVLQDTLALHRPLKRTVQRLFSILEYGCENLTSPSTLVIPTSQ